MSAPTIAAVLAMAAAASAVLVFASPRRWRGGVAGVGSAVAGVVAICLAAKTVASGFPDTRVGSLLPLTGAAFGGDGLSSLFTLVTGAVAIPVGLFAVGYVRHSPMPSVCLATLPLFVGAMAILPFAASVTTFLLLWELMALASLVLVLSEHHEPEVRSAGVVYAVMTQLGFAAILIGLSVFAAAAHGDSFAALAAGRLAPGARTAVFALSLIGFGSKAGLIPLHAWLPRAHPAAPSPVSALMSAAMVNLGIYGVLRFDVRLLGSTSTWYGVALVVVGGATAIYAVLQASVASDLKRLLAYSTSENMGLVLLALGAALVLDTAGNRAAAAVALVAALLHVVNHAAFKTLGFLSVGAVTAGTGTRDLDQLGGIAHRMPVTSSMFGIAALGAAGLPFGAGFVSEWLLLQALIHTQPSPGTTLALVMPIAVGVVALTAGLAGAAMVKAFGIGFLARARSGGASSAREVSVGMRLAMLLPAMACGVLAVAPSAASPILRSAVESVDGEVGHASTLPKLGLLLRLPGVGGSMSPALLAVMAAAGVLLLATVLGRRSGVAGATPAPLWACGGGPLTSRMQYTATSFAEPLQRVFDDVLRPDIDIDVTHYAESRYLVEKVSYRSRIGDVIETRVHTPILRWIAAWGALVKRAHTGSVHVYLGYGAVGLLIALVIAR